MSIQPVDGRSCRVWTPTDPVRWWLSLTGTLSRVGENRLSVFVNPAAGGNRGLIRARRIVGELADLGWTVDLVRLSGPADLARSIERLQATGAERVVLAGGDGMIHLALPALVGSSMATGIVATGTGNDFCRGLGLPSNRRSAIIESVSDVVNPVDIIELHAEGSSHFAASVMTFGFSGRVNAMANEMRFPRGTSRYTMATVRQLGSLEPVPVTMAFDDESAVEREVTFVAVGNTPYFGGGMKICPDARYDDGLLDVVVVEPVSAPTLARVLPLVFAGKHVGHGAVSVRRCHSLEIHGDEPLWADGEALAVNSARVSVRSGALRVAGTLG